MIFHGAHLTYFARRRLQNTRLSLVRLFRGPLLRAEPSSSITTPLPEALGEVRIPLGQLCVVTFEETLRTPFQYGEDAQRALLWKDFPSISFSLRPEIRDHMFPEQPDRVHDVLMRNPAELHEAQYLIHPGRLELFQDANTSVRVAHAEHSSFN